LPTCCHVSSITPRCNSARRAAADIGALAETPGLAWHAAYDVAVFDLAGAP